jgi:hypothetical protein
MARPACVLALLLVCGACATERHTTFVAEPTRAVLVPSDAQLLAESRTACTGYGLQAGTPSYDRCVANEFAARRPG